MADVVLLFGEPPTVTSFVLGTDTSVFAQTAPALRGWKASYDLAGTQVSGVARTAREVTVPIVVHGEKGRENAALLSELISRSLDGLPARVSVQGWSRRVFLPALTIQEVTRYRMTAELTVILLDGLWEYEGSPVRVVRASSADTSLDHDYDHDYDLAGMTSTSVFPGGSVTSKDVLARLFFFGPCQNPTLTIGENRFSVRTDVPEGAYLRVDPLTRTCEVTYENGTVRDVFAQAVRGDGIDSGSYIFQPLPARDLEITYGGDFDFSIVPIYRRDWTI